MLFYNDKGNEYGGIAISNPGNSRLKAIAFDYSNADAIGLFARDDSDGRNFQAGLIINDKVVGGKAGAAVSRITLNTSNGNAGLVINGPDEEPRIKISVDSLGKPLFQILNEKGEIIQQFSDLKK